MRGLSMTICITPPDLSTINSQGWIRGGVPAYVVITCTLPSGYLGYVSLVFLLILLILWYLNIELASRTKCHRSRLQDLSWLAKIYLHSITTLGFCFLHCQG